MFNKVCLFLIMILFAGLIITGAKQQGAWQQNIVTSSDYTGQYVKNITVDNYRVTGENIQYYQAVPQRVIAVGENILETFAALEIEDSLLLAIGYDNPFFRPDEQYAVRYNNISKQSVLSLNMEKVLSLRPDLIVGGQVLFSDSSLKSTRFWNTLNVHTFCALNANAPGSQVRKETLEQEFAFITGLGKIFNKEKRAEEIVKAMQQDISIVQKTVKDRKKMRVMIIEDLGGWVVYGKDKLAGDICSRLGGELISCKNIIGLEDIINAEPDIIFVVKSDGDPEKAAEDVKKIPVLRNLRCIKDNRVYGISLNYMYNSAVKTSAGIRLMAAAMYPDLAGKQGE